MNDDEDIEVLDFDDENSSFEKEKIKTLDELRNEVKEEIKKVYGLQIKHELKNEMRSELLNEVKEELKSELRPIIEEEIRNENLINKVPEDIISIPINYSNEIEVSQEISEPVIEEVELKEDTTITPEVIEVIENKKDIKKKNNQTKKENKRKKKETKKEEIESKKNRKSSKKKKLKSGIIQNIFVIFSLLAILACLLYYGQRFFKYYKIFNPKSESGESITLLGNAIFQNSPIATDGDGLYNTMGVYTYKGKEVNNYLKYSDYMWRILHTNNDGSVDIVLDTPINVLAFDFNNNNYINSDIHKYVNDIFLKTLDTSYLAKTNICIDYVDDVNSFSCNQVNSEYYVKLIAMNDFLNSEVNNASYLANEDDIIWLGTSSSDGKAWLSNNVNLSNVDAKDYYYVKPVVTIKNTVGLLSGNGSYDNPFVIDKDENKIKVGSYIKLDNDVWVVYEKNDKTLKLAYSKLYGGNLDNYRFDVDTNIYNPSNKDSLAYLLNNKFYNSLSYKDMLLDIDVYTGDYKNSYKDIYSNKVTAKVGLLNVVDFKIDNTVTGYYLSNGNSENGTIYYYDNNYVESKIGISRYYRPTISINVVDKFTGNGTLDDPYVMEVKDE